MAIVCVLKLGLMLLVTFEFRMLLTTIIIELISITLYIITVYIIDDTTAIYSSIAAINDNIMTTTGSIYSN